MATYPWLDELRFGPDGLVPVIAQDAVTGDVLMLAWANREALERTLTTGDGHYFSRSRQALWRKGETSGHTQRVVELRADCDRDTVLYRVEQSGPACHTGERTCFVSALDTAGLHQGPDAGGHALERLRRTIAIRAAERPAGSYTVHLLDHGPVKISQKVGEEAVEVVVAANAESDERLASEAADLLYHLLVLLQARGVAADDVWRELARRAR
ncbi:MAG: bifunctional phosphoribosyl-AMP cyclohydrolase/phosphoribosyl-ATP diphosphatase HisIE [Gemmatimonadales bacterium]|jgi:phosphoribosyl-ATP pyrophosphohydrolase/phosphoribosyl-AMP cyclohydrolase|nr:bifunctional phosphoribosyl-AMP cyclohydrolase/phosphoribosyl-ATP diphosphatase HisIE [Vicinamibacterales bacterium]MCU0620025.1 bifunctional phosphoribosyl-AMP cyclohydrolase/phosphoribosyl-ATP diphosphatase HisIE [Gemmatimonadales bacterium]